MLGIICGNGDLPILLSNFLLKKNISFCTICLDYSNYNILQNIKHPNNYLLKTINIKQILQIIKQSKINQIVMCGGVKFSGLENISIPLSKIHYLLYALLSCNKGDNFLLNIASKMLKSENVELIAIQDIIPEILTTKNDNINTNLSNQYENSIQLGVKILNNNSQFDIGQSIIIQNGRVLGVEAVEGTTELIKRCAILKNDLKKQPILIKMPKLGQNMKLDLPTIGLKTIQSLIEGGYAGLVIKNESVIFLDKQESKELLKQNNMFLKVLD